MFRYVSVRIQWLKHVSKRRDITGTAEYYIAYYNLKRTALSEICITNCYRRFIYFHMFLFVMKFDMLLLGDANVNCYTLRKVQTANQAPILMLRTNFYLIRPLSPMRLLINLLRHLQYIRNSAMICKFTWLHIKMITFYKRTFYDITSYVWKWVHLYKYMYNDTSFLFIYLRIFTV